MLLRAFREGIFECCSPASFGKPDYLVQEQHISARPQANIFESASGGLQLYFQRWQSDRHHQVSAVVFAHHGETDHCGWYNALAVRLTAFGCTTFAPDAQGFGQSDGVRGYFEAFEDLVADFVKFCKLKWSEVLDARGRAGDATRPGFVLMGKGLGALVVMRALVELHELAASWGVTPVVILLSPGFRFSNFIEDQSNGTCGLDTGQCERHGGSHCATLAARAPASFAPVGEATRQKLEHISRWVPKKIATDPVEPDMVSRDQDVVDRMNRDVLCWRHGYRARVLADLVHEQAELPGLLAERADVFHRCPALLLHGSGDKLYTATSSHSLHSAWCDLARQSGVYPRLKIYDGAFHQLLNEPNREEVLTDISHFIASKAL